MAKTKDAKDDGAVTTGTKDPKILQPPHNVHLARKKNAVVCRIDLYKIPPKFVNFDPTNTHLYVDTLKYTKKYLLKVPYPEGVEVNPTDVEAVFDSGVIRCELPIVSDPNKPAGYDEMIEARQQVKELRNEGKHVPAKLLKKANMKTIEPKTEEQVPALVPAKKAAAPKAKSPKSAEKKTKRALVDEEDDTPKKSKKAKIESSEPKEPKKKNFLDTTSALAVADEVNDLQEKQIQEKFDKEYAKLSVETRKKIEAREKKNREKEIRQIEAAKVMSKPKAKKATKKSATKVSFNV